MREWYVNGPLGVEQGFTLTTRPAGAYPASVRLALRLSGNVRVSLAGHTGLTLTGPDGASLRYSGLSVTDARGRTLPASLGVRSGLLTIMLADRGAQYPITVDPYIQEAELTNNDDGHGQLGYSVAIDGDTIVAGAPQVTVNDHPQQGALYVFTKPASGWSNATQTAKLTASDGQPTDFLGGSVAISGNTVVAGAPGVGGGAGAVYVFVEPPSGWANTTESAKLSVAGGSSADLGYSVAVSGNTVVAGADSEEIGANVGQGAAYVFLKPGTGWHSDTQNAELTASDGEEGDALGRSVAIDGDTVVAGAEFANGERGAAYVFVKPAAGWPAQETQTAKLTASGDSADRAGRSVAISGDTVAVGAPGVEGGPSPGNGEVFVFVEPAGGWTSETPTAELVASNGQGDDALGESVAIDGSTIVAGAPDAALNVGAAYLFVRPPGGWVNSTETAELTSPGGGESPELGSSIGISGQEIVAGAPGPPVAVGSLPGAAFVFGPTPPVTSVSLSPAAPNGRNGWYLSPVQVAVTASDDVSTVAETSCALDPPETPTGFGALSPGCPFAGAGGGTVAGDGAHSVYASSIDSAGDAGAVGGVSFRIDRTPPTVTCGPTPTFVLGKRGEVTATVTDATSGPISDVVAARPNASIPGTRTVTLTGFDNAGNAATVRCPYRVLARRIDARLNWGANQFPSFTVISGLTLVHVPSGARIVLVCKGAACPSGHYARPRRRHPTGVQPPPQAVQARARAAAQQCQPALAARRSSPWRRDQAHDHGRQEANGRRGVDADDPRWGGTTRNRPRVPGARGEQARPRMLTGSLAREASAEAADAEARLCSRAPGSRIATVRREWMSSPRSEPGARTRRSPPTLAARAGRRAARAGALGAEPSPDEPVAVPSPGAGRARGLEGRRRSGGGLEARPRPDAGRDDDRSLRGSGPGSGGPVRDRMRGLCGPARRARPRARGLLADSGRAQDLRRGWRRSASHRASGSSR